ncbi:unnamed protein product [Calicophoron daubneyi]|uniref:Cdc23 domain-containing protein n=1 Tax=Calicophoron daubneyi TaxID=300641 RepID=A0AAV2T5W9_CALDB
MKSSSEEVGYPISLDAVRRDVLRTFFDCQIRGLIQSCKWLGDLLHSLESQDAEDTIDFYSNSAMKDIPSKQLPKFLFARSLFDAREYDYCAQILAPLVCPHISPVVPVETTLSCNALLYFLYIYARYMACEKRRANDEVELRRVFEQDGSVKPSQVAMNRCTKELSALRREIEVHINPAKLDSDASNYLKHMDPFVLYVYGLVYRRVGIIPIAIKLFNQAITTNPCLWPAWYELSQLVKDKEQLNSLKLPASNEAWMHYFFEAKVYLKLHESERALVILQCLSNSGFSESPNLQAEIGLAYDGQREMDLASKQFKRLFTAHPCRLDNVDAYSNVLFVREESAELAHLAHHCVGLDKYRPETCCVVGNFFSLRGQHDKAVLYFQRALKLKPSYSLVWTLVGHEYTELRNTNAAVHAYRQAIAHNRHDFRAWYGLGQMYEILDLPSFALHYYREAQYLVPTDSRLIVALGEIYERLNRLEEAKKCYWRAYCVGDIEGSALLRLAQCFVQSGEAAEAAAAYTEFIKLCEHHGVQSQTELAMAYRFLAMFHLQMGHYEDAAAAANKCLEFPEVREEAKAMFRQITVLAGDVEIALTDGSSEGPSTSEEPVAIVSISGKDPSSSSTQPHDSRSASSATPLPFDKSEISDLPGIRSSERPANSHSAPEAQPLDLSLGYLLAALGEVNGAGSNTPSFPQTRTHSSSCITPCGNISHNPTTADLHRETTEPPLTSAGGLPSVSLSCLSTTPINVPNNRGVSRPSEQQQGIADVLPDEGSSPGDEVMRSSDTD